ncbi:MAG TPA: TraB/GumN family protein [Sediminibacterium sp.]|nr:TraB/GumN family protein [Sediminibacterium sp.]
MAKRLFTALLILFFLKTDAQSSLLWEISGNQLKKPSYLFGTFHLICQSDFSISAKLADKLRAAEQFYAELDITQPGMQQELMTQLTLKETTLSTLMGSARFEKARVSFKQITGLDLQGFNQFKPFMSLNLLALYAIPCADKLQPETLFFQMAKANNIPVGGLETLTDQIAAIDAQPMESQLKTLAASLQNYDSVKLMMKQLLSVYKLKNSDSLYSFMQQHGSDDYFEKELIEKRNTRWISRIQNTIRNKATFFAVGAGHLGGKAGLIALLRKQGFTLKPINY